MGRSTPTRAVLYARHARGTIRPGTPTSASADASRTAERADPDRTASSALLGLSQVHPIVSRPEPKREVVALGAALAANADPRAVTRTEPRPQLEVRPAQELEQVDEARRVILAVAQSRDPQGLVVADDVGRVSAMIQR